MRKIALRWVPNDLTKMQKWLRYDTARTHLERYVREGEAFLCRIITLDETWAKSYDLQMKCQSNEWWCYESPRKSKFCQNPSNVTVMVILVYDCDGVIITHTVPQWQTVSAQYLCSYLEHNLSFEKEAATFSAEPTHHFAEQCSGTCKLWLFCSMHGAGKCCTIHHTP
jgi:hypothetical protein